MSQGRLAATLSSEGKGHTFESCRVHHKINDLAECPEVGESKTHHKLTQDNPALAQNLRHRGSFSYESPVVFCAVAPPESWAFRLDNRAAAVVAIRNGAARSSGRRKRNPSIRRLNHRIETAIAANKF